VSLTKGIRENLDFDGGEQNAGQTSMKAKYAVQRRGPARRAERIKKKGDASSEARRSSCKAIRTKGKLPRSEARENVEGATLWGGFRERPVPGGAKRIPASCSEKRNFKKSTQLAPTAD